MEFMSLGTIVMRAVWKILVFALVPLVSSSAVAGDFATLETIGFSADGTIFAFGQHGVQDGSGFPYTEIVFVDLDKDAFVAPSPIKVRLVSDGADVAMARKAAREKAAGLLEAHSPDDNPGLVVADNPPTEISAADDRLVFIPRSMPPSADAFVGLDLDLIPLAPTTSCKGVDVGKSVGFRLTKTYVAVSKTSMILHEDNSIPDSRGCPTGYRLSRVVVFEPKGRAPQAVAIIGVRSIGFEGPNLRFIASAVPLP